MRTLLVRFLQVALVVMVAAAGWYAYRAQREGPTAAPALGKSLVLGPAGIARLRLGMTPAEANATGAISYQPVWPTAGSTNCATLQTTEGAVFHFSRTHGLAAITAPDAVRTPEGIGMGATLAELRAAYPKAHPLTVAGEYAAPAPGNAAASYRFLLDGNGVRFVTLVLDDQGEECAPAER